MEPFNKPQKEKKMKKTSYSVLISVLVITVALAVLSLVGSSRATAQGDPRYKVGDRVEVDTFMHGWGWPGAEKSAVWRKGTVIKLYDPEDRFGGYIVKVDEDGREMR